MKLAVTATDDKVNRLTLEGTLAPLPGTIPQAPLGQLPGSARAAHDVLLDLQRVDYINSAGISWLIQAHKQVASEGGQLVLHSLSAPVARTLDLVRLSSVLTIAPDEPSALARVGR